MVILDLSYLTELYGSRIAQESRLGLLSVILVEEQNIAAII